MMVIASFAEVFTIGAVLPFIQVLTQPQHIFELAAAQPFVNFLSLTDPKQLLLPITIVFASAAIFSGGMRLLLLWASTKLSFATGADFSASIYNRTLYQSYAIHCSRNSSEVINGISVKSNGVIHSVILPILTLISSALMLVAILIFLLAIEPRIAICAFLGFGMIYACVIGLTRKKLMADSICIASEGTQVIKSLQEGLGGIRDVLIDGTQAVYCQIFSDADLALRRAQGRSMFISLSPRYGVEALGMVLIALLAYTLAKSSGGLASAVPILGALALGSQRLLPILQQTYSAWAQITSGQATLEDTLELLEQPLPATISQNEIAPLKFKNQITISQLNFRYASKSPYVLKNINLTIEKGSRVGFIGTTGSGKSTLLDIVMGLLHPTSGSLSVDHQRLNINNLRNWQSRISHVPQSIYLADSTIEENIAFGVPKDKIDTELVRHAARQAQLAETIEGWEEKYHTIVGERGIRLSGGQRQRIGIARALYKQADIIIFDEATSALDEETESAVMHSIEGLSKDLTLLIIAHRLTTLRNCSKIVELNKGVIKRVGTYESIVNLTPQKTDLNVD
jgi:ATP-binding cassette subfamily B protein